MARLPLNLPGYDSEEVLAHELGVSVLTMQRWRRVTRRTGKQHGPRWTVVDYSGRIAYSHQHKREYLESRQHRAPRSPRQRAKVPMHGS
jgi:hypothetical protein